ncbi:unnamed protein product [Paramecium primaurelia]|uniref:Uncharacterized protein n=1 Tax=Paramecium primaurelia TaxID=5886 RepID=A0A8S1N1Y2_PARPR|nr:unnamed protein product [Paramecium primaurelia]
MAKQMKTVYLALNPLREFIGEFKVFICLQYNIDKNNNCQTYLNLNLYFFQSNLHTNKCKQGYFEIEKECSLYPSIVNKNMIIFFESYSNPLNWQFDLTCQKYLFLSDLGSIEQSFFYEGQEIYYFDGTPDYISYSRQCKKCIIDYFIYFLEYICYNQNFCSLLPSYPIFENKSQNQISCALCQDNQNLIFMRILVTLNKKFFKFFN